MGWVMASWERGAMRVNQVYIHSDSRVALWFAGGTMVHGSSPQSWRERERESVGVDEREPAAGFWKQGTWASGRGKVTQGRGRARSWHGMHGKSKHPQQSATPRAYRIKALTRETSNGQLDSVVLVFCQATYTQWHISRTKKYTGTWTEKNNTISISI
jgi:hypothetical protein